MSVEKIQNYANLPPGWAGGENDIAPSNETIANAVCLYNMLPSIFHISCGTNNEIAFEYRDDFDFLYLFVKDNALIYMYRKKSKRDFYKAEDFFTRWNDFQKKYLIDVLLYTIYGLKKEN